MFNVSYYLMFIISVCHVLKNMNHLLMCLLGLEGLMLIVFYLLGMSVAQGFYSFMILLVYLCVSVGEGVMGLALLIGSVRGVGQDKFYYINLL